MTTPTLHPGSAPWPESRPAEVALRHSARGRARRLSILETQVAFLLLGIGLAGVCPLIVMQVRLSRRVAAGFNQNGYLQAVTPAAPARRTFLVMSPDPWAQARVPRRARETSPGPSQPLPAPASGQYTLSLITPITRPFGTDSVVIQLQRIPPVSPGGSTTP